MVDSSRNFYDKQNDVVIGGIFIATVDFDPSKSLEEQPDKVLDIQNMVTSLSIFEDIGSHFLHGEVTIADRINLIDQMPLNGNEQLVVYYRSPLNSTVIINMQIAGQKSRVRPLGSKTDVIVLRLTSEGHAIDTNQYTSYKTEGNGLEVVEQIIETFNLNYSRLIRRRGGGYIGTGNPPLVTKDATDRRILNFCFPYQRPSQMIQQIAECSIPEKDERSSKTDDLATGVENAGYVFYETLEGFNFRAVNSLMFKEPKAVFTQFDNLRIMDSPDGETNNFSKRAEEMSVDVVGQTAFDRVSNKKFGVFGSANYSHDITTKRWNFEPYNYATNAKPFEGFTPKSVQIGNKDFVLKPRKKVINTSDLSNSVSLTKTNLVNTQSEPLRDALSGRVILGLNRTPGEELYKVKRFADSNMSLLGDTQYEVTVSGASDLSAGDTIFLQLIRNSTPRQGEDEIDDEKSGVYLIKSIHHFFVIGSQDVQTYKTSMRVVRNFRHNNVPQSPKLDFNGVIKQ